MPTRDAIVADVLQQMDATGSARWDTAGATSEVVTILSQVFDKEWKRLLNAQPFYRTQRQLLTSDASTGRIAISALSPGTGNTQKRFYRVLGVARNQMPYEEGQMRDWLLAEDLGLQVRIWYREGDNLMFLPKETSAAFDIWSNYLPQRPDGLSAGGDTVDFPNGYEKLLRFEAAAWLLTKGGAEADTALRLQAYAEQIRQDMLQDLARTSTKPQRMAYSDMPWDWGG